MEQYLDSISKKADTGEIFAYRNKTEAISFESGKIKDFDSSSSVGYAIRLAKNGKMGFSYGNDLHKVEEAIDNALITSKYSQEAPFAFAAKTELPEFSKQIYHEEIENFSHQAMIAYNHKLCDGLHHYDATLLPDSCTTKCCEEVAIYTTEGFSNKYLTSRLIVDIDTTIVRPEDIYSWGNSAISLTTEIDFAALFNRLYKDIDIGRNVVPSISGKLPVIFAPSFLSNLYMVLSAGISDHGIYRQTSPLVGKLNSKLFDERIHIYEDPYECDMLDFRPFDHEGTIVQRKPIIENGILKNYLVTRKYAEQLNLPATGNGYRVRHITKDTDTTLAPAVSGNTMVITAGDMPLAEMLADIKQGVFCILAPNIFQGNIINGDFCGTLYLCYKIDNGKLTGRMKNLSISGNIYRLLRDNLVAISQETSLNYAFWKYSNMLKAPYFYLKDVTISG